MGVQGLFMVQWCDGYASYVLVTCCALIMRLLWYMGKSRKNIVTHSVHTQTDPPLVVENAPIGTNAAPSEVQSTIIPQNVYISKNVSHSMVYHTKLCTCLVGGGYSNIEQLCRLRKCLRC